MLIVFTVTFELSPWSEPRKRPKGHCCVFIPLRHIEKQYLTIKITSIECSLYTRYCSNTSHEWSHWIFTKLTWSISSRWWNRGTERLTNLPRATQHSSDLGFQPWLSGSRAQTCIDYILLPSRGPQRDLGPNPGATAYQLWDSGQVTLLWSQFSTLKRWDLILAGVLCIQALMNVCSLEIHCRATPLH